MAQANLLDCPACSGVGHNGELPCPTCFGTGDTKCHGCRSAAVAEGVDGPSCDGCLTGESLLADATERVLEQSK